MFKDRILTASRNMPLAARALAFFKLGRRNGFLNESGWIESFKSGMPVDKKKQPLPWFTYSAIAFLEQRIEKHMDVFEFGSGNSTLWWSKKVSRLVSCEHDEKWYRLMKPKLPASVEYLYNALTTNGDYAKAILKQDAQFDIIVIDGRDRVNCVKNSLNSLKSDGIVIWDNSDRQEYREGYDFLVSNGFKRLDFPGLGPINSAGWCTSVFYRTTNCIGL